MNVLILRSAKRETQRRPDDPYAQVFDSAYAARVVGNLIGEKGFCSSCGPDCNACRQPYNRTYAENIAAIIDLPAVLGHLLEDPGRHVPQDIPPHDVLLAIDIHEQIMVEMVRRCAGRPARGVVVPLEAPDSVSGAARAQARRICADRGVEIAFPKPFCDFNPPAGGVLDEFRRRFHIGRPAVELTVKDGRIEKAHVEVSAACGATYYVARWLQGRRVDEDLKYEVVAKRMHSFPCTASMKWDDELGDTVMHVASRAHDEILAPLQGRDDPRGPSMIRSPLGTMVVAPARPGENVENVDRIREAILEALARENTVSLRGLMAKSRVTSAALSSALLGLKREGRIHVQGDSVRKA